MMRLAALLSFWREVYESVSRTLLRAKRRVNDETSSSYLGASVGVAIGAAIGLLWCAGLCVFMLMWPIGLCIDLPMVLAISVIGGGVIGLLPAGAPGAVSWAKA